MYSRRTVWALLHGYSESINLHSRWKLLISTPKADSKPPMPRAIFNPWVQDSFAFASFAAIVPELNPIVLNCSELPGFSTEIRNN